MPRRIESHMLAGPAGRLEALLEEPDCGTPTEAALVLHPHPRHGGTMHNKVVYRLARALRRGGAVVLRFNYRGVNLSDGVYGHGAGELDDARAALAWLKSRYLDLPVTVAGFSFGSRIAMRLGCESAGVSRIILAGLPTNYHLDLARLKGCRVPKHFIQSTHDQYGSRGDLKAFFATLAGPKTIHWIESRDHFFAGGLDRLESVVAELGKRVSTQPPDAFRAPGGESRAR